MPSHVVSILSLLVLATGILARYRFRLAGRWRRTYAIAAVIALYFNVFVLIAQLFQKVPTLKALAPTQSEPPFQLAELTVLAIFTLLAVKAGGQVSHAASKPRRESGARNVPGIPR